MTEKAMTGRIAIIILILTGAVLMGMVLYNEEPAPLMNGKISFGRGEVIEYRAHYGFLNAAVAKMVIADEIYNVNDKKCYRIDIFGESVGVFDLAMNIEDNWGTYLDTAEVLPQRFWRILKEGSYRKHEIVNFDQEARKAGVVTYDYKQKRWREEQMFEIPFRSQDMVSGYYYLRTIDMSKYKEGDIITIDGFFDNETYNFKIRYLGKEMLKTKLGTFKTHFFSPIMPKNGLFDGENSIKFWLSDDKYKIPLKIRAEMYVGAVELDITSYEPSPH